jgi:hypothetical protein
VCVRVCGYGCGCVDMGVGVWIWVWVWVWVESFVVILVKNSIYSNSVLCVIIVSSFLFSYLQNWYGSANRGKVPIGWTISPALSELAPSVMKRFYSQIVPGMDNFVAGPSGVGYTVPDKFTNVTSLDAFATLSSAYMDKSDLRVVNLIADTDCDLKCSEPFAQAGADGVFLYEGDAYVGRGGRISWAGDCPIVGGRYAFWDGHETAASLAKKLRQLSKDPHNPDSYSLVPVHVWTRNVSDVVAAVALLGDFFDVVTPEVFVDRLQANVFHDCGRATPSNGPYKETCSGGVDNCGVLKDVVCQTGKSSSLHNAFFDHSVCESGVVTNCFGRLQCEGSECVCLGPATGSYSASCSGCTDVCGVLTGCKCAGSVVPNFDYTVCDGLAVADCFGTLICQGQPCE